MRKSGPRVIPPIGLLGTLKSFFHGKSNRAPRIPESLDLAFRLQPYATSTPELQVQAAQLCHLAFLIASRIPSA